jgi:phosphatidylglycerophosphate synthase
MGDNWNPLASFQELGTLPKVLLLVGFCFLTTSLLHGANLSDRVLPIGLALISFSLSVHYFSQSRAKAIDSRYTTPFIDWGKICAGVAMLLVTVALIVWAMSTAGKAPQPVSTAEHRTTKFCNRPLSL